MANLYNKVIIFNKQIENKKIELGKLVTVKSGKSVKSEYGQNLYGSTGIIGKTSDGIYDGDVNIIARVGANTGYNYFIEEDKKYGVSDNALIVIPREKDSNPKFYYYYLSTLHLKKLSFGSGQPLITATQLKKIKVQSYNIDFQDCLAFFLSQIDNLIKSHDIKINRLRSVKVHYINYYFNNLDRDTVEYNLSELVDSSRGKGIQKDDLNENGKYKCILYGELFTKYSSVISNVKSRTDSLEGISSFGNEVLLPSSTTTGAREIAIASALLEKNVKIGSDIIILRCKKKIYNQYLAYYLRYYSWKEISKVAVGITIIHLYAKDIMDISIKVPALEKQKDFINMLSSMEKLIEIEKKKMDQLELMKKYYLQQFFS
ncbi:restriction endonuclease subunit S [Mollicutes bacterium LVI A0039]|nr:restriction endonuclease subunit S [Mollicutes bacterium LVI A0039]